MRKALIVGINDYPNSPLRGCVNDALAMKGVLETHADGSPNFGIKLITSPSDTITRVTLRAQSKHFSKAIATLLFCIFLDMAS